LQDPVQSFVVLPQGRQISQGANELNCTITHHHDIAGMDSFYYFDLTQVRISNFDWRRAIVV
jgi:hypothetical protein